MADTKRTAYKNNWQREHNDRINLTIPKGQKEHIKSHASAHDESTNAFINRAISDAIKQDELLEQSREKIFAIAKKNCVDMVNIDDQELKKLAVAFAALEPKIPNIMDCYFLKCQPPQEHQPKTIALTPQKID